MDFTALYKLGRFREIVMIFLKYGFGDLVARLDLPGFHRAEEEPAVAHDAGTYGRIRQALEELGPTFIKFGQIMSLRPDLLPQSMIDELAKLQDDVSPISYEEIREVVEKVLDKPLKDLFRVFDPMPVAAASLSQVHRAVLLDNGNMVAVKVRRPGIKQKVEKDFDILTLVVDRLHSHVEELKIYDLPTLLKLTKEMLTRELNFKMEARYTKIAKSHLSGEDGVYVPEVFFQYCREQLLVVEYIQGEKVKAISAESFEDAQSLAGKGLRTAIKQILEDGFFHADPHPGNFLVTPDNSLCLIDWGMVGRLTRESRYELIDLIQAIVENDTEKLVKMLISIARPAVDINKRDMERDILDILDYHLSVSLSDLDLGRLLLNITGLLRKYQLRLPADLGIMIKALITAEGSARLIYPDLDVIAEAGPQIKALAVNRYKPGMLWRMAVSKLSGLFSPQGGLPGQLFQIVEKIERGKLNIRFEHENLGGLMNTLENISNRLTFGIIIGALIIGSSMIITTGIGPLLFGFPALGVIGYIISGCLGLWLIFNIIRKRRL